MENAGKAKDEVTDWFKMYQQELHRYALRITHSDAVSKDLVQETFIAAFESFTSFKNLSQPKTWLYSILKRKIADHFRNEHKMVSGEEFAEEALPDDVNLLDDVSFLRHLRRALAALPRRWRKIVVARYYQEKSTTEICDFFKITPQNYWQIIHRSKQLLREYLAGF